MNTIYKLIKYELNSIEEEVVAEDFDLETIAQRALTRSQQDGDYYHYRIDTYENDQWVGKCRWFNNGREITEEIIKAALGGIR